VDLWFNEPLHDHPVDIVHRHQMQEPVPGSLCTPFHTWIVDLRCAESDLLSNVHKDTRYEIRRAKEKDGVKCGTWDGQNKAVWDRFVFSFDTFAQQKGLAKLDVQNLGRLVTAGCLDLSWASTGTEDGLVYHAHLVSGDRVRLLHSASLFRASSSSEFRNLVGRANRLLHWDDMMRFKANRIVTYDFGGWYEGAEDVEKLRINSFKEGFGGCKTVEYNCTFYVTIKARVVTSLKRWLKRRNIR
jgi:hypothetical protein